LLKVVEEFRKYVIITGFNRARIWNTDEFLQSIRKTKEAEVEIQFFDAELIATWEHLYFAALNALTAFKNKTGISKSLAMETMLYASAQRQIRKATELAGIKATTVDLALLIIGDKKKDVESALSTIQKNLDAQRDDNVLKITKEKMMAIKKTFRISDLELGTVRKKGEGIEKALTSLVIERMALLATRR
jgi:tRNA threonylcarbamoyladenosine modification (KEOPS) complex Cgi121 subunit